MTRAPWQAWAVGVLAAAALAGVVAAAALAVRGDARGLAAQTEAGSARALTTLGTRAQALVEPLARMAVGAPGDNAVAARSAYRDLLDFLHAHADPGRDGAAPEPGIRADLARIIGAIEARHDDILALGSRDKVGAEHLFVALAPHVQALGGLADRAQDREARAAAVLSAQTRAGLTNTLRLVAATAVLVALALALLGHQHFRGRRLEAEKAAAEAMRVARDHGHLRLLATIRRELRAPMRRVLAPLAALRDSNLSDEQHALRTCAENAARQLAGTLGDILTIEQGAAAATDADAAPFRLGSLAQDLRAAFGAAAGRDGACVDVTCSDAAAEQVRGDGRRFQRALGHLCDYVLDRAGARHVALALSHGDGEVRAALAFDYPPGAGDAATLRELAAASPLDAPSALGPLLARGVLERIGGRLEVSNLEDGRVLMLAAAPAAIDAAGGPRIRVVAQSLTLAALGAASARAGRLDLLPAEAAPAPDIVLIEAGGAGERVTLAQVRARYPAALLIALGDPVVPGAFDGVIRPPLLPDRVGAEVARVWAHAATPRDARAEALPRRALQG